ncbi:MAG: hypothetical protein ACE5QF_02150 [Thermoplasmata archaeon]
MIKSGRFRAGLWVLRRLPGSRLLHKLAYSPNIGPGFRLGRGACIIGEDVHVGEDVSIGRNTVILGKEISLGDGVSIGSNVEINCKKVRVGERTRIDESCTVGGLSTPRSELEIGKEVHVFEDCYLNTTNKLTIGNGTGIGGRTMIWTHGSWQSILEGYPVSFAPTTLGENVWLPWHIIVMPGVTIGSGATIGAGAVVTKDVPPGSLAAGVPARVLKDASSYPRKVEMEEKARIASDIIDDFGESLNGIYSVRFLVKKRESYNTRRDGNVWTVSAPHEQWRLVLITDPARFSEFKPDGSALVLSLLPVEDAIWQRSREFYGIFDLSERVYSVRGSSFVVDTLLQILGRYGIHMSPRQR